ncbi:outer membrane beta-barrel protein [Undibacterium sp. TJN25]|uniref:outer membrane beta-barrel protein n=1 Tax=Undibacterium sp. TJN25 TaxID=3413056 RepID=UPI003BEFA9F7
MTMMSNMRTRAVLASAGLGLLAMTAAGAASAQEAAGTSSAMTNPATPANPAASNGAVAGCAAGSDKLSLSDRFVSSYKDALGWNGDPAGDPSWRQGYQPPQQSTPPMPFTGWPIGGTEIIGYDNSYSGALMDAIYCGPNGQAWKDSRVTIYGWINPGMNLSSSHTRYNTKNGTGGNFPAAYNYAPNTAQMDQVALYAERTPDVVQKDHFDWGFRLAGVWGTDAKYTISRGLFSNRLSNGNGDVVKNSYDIPMAYLEGYFPNVADGMNVRVGRYISVPDIEAQLAPNNYTYSHSLLYTYDPFTHEGVVATVKLNKNWTVQGELHLGNDVAAWYSDKVPATFVNAAGNTVANPNAGQKLGAQITPGVCVQWLSDSGDDALYPCINGIGIGNKNNFGWNNMQQDVLTWYHKFNDKWHMSTEAWYMSQKNTPNMSNTDGPALWNSMFGTTNSVGGPFGATGGRGCGPNDGITCTSKEWAVVNYIIYQPGPRDFFALRTDILNDINGQRTGFATKYTEMTLSWNHWLGKAITLRPEIRYEHAGVAAYNNPCPAAGTAGCGATVTAGARHQTTFAMDAIVHF